MSTLGVSPCLVVPYWSREGSCAADGPREAAHRVLTGQVSTASPGSTRASSVREAISSLVNTFRR